MKPYLLLVAFCALACRPALAKEPDPRAEDEAAIRAAVQSYVAAYNRGDAKGVAEFWSDTGEWISPSGQKAQGRAEIEKQLETMFAAAKGLRLEVLGSSIRFVTNDVAVEEGRVKVTAPGESPDESTYIAIQVKKDGKWKLDSVHETEVPEAAPPDTPLADLQWLVGDWVDQSPDVEIDTTVTWTKNKTFLNYAFKASMPGKDELEGTQVIGWDPAAGTIRSWMFDSDGGFGEGTWSKKDNRWIVKFNQVLPDGRKASATNIYTLVDDNTYTWQSIARQVDGQFLPNVEPVKIVRKTAIETEQPAEKPAEAEKTEKTEKSEAAK
jgi:uncharacterized protein (TIGR02246 family)